MQLNFHCGKKKRPHLVTHLANIFSLMWPSLQSLARSENCDNSLHEIFASRFFLPSLRSRHAHARQQFLPEQPLKDDTRCQDSHSNKDQVFVMDCLQLSVLLGVIALLRKATISFAINVSVRPHGTNRISLDVFSWKLIFWDFDWNLSFKARPGSKLINIWGILREELCTYLAKYFVGGKGKIQWKVVVNVTIHISFYVIFPENRAMCETVTKNAAEPYRPVSYWS